MKTKLFFTAVVFSALTVIAAGQTAQSAQQVQPGQGRAAGNVWVDVTMMVYVTIMKTEPVRVAGHTPPVQTRQQQIAARAWVRE